MNLFQKICMWATVYIAQEGVLMWVMYSLGIEETTGWENIVWFLMVIVFMTNAKTITDYLSSSIEDE